jgi:hypothetical protein
MRGEREEPIRANHQSGGQRVVAGQNTNSENELHSQIKYTPTENRHYKLNFPDMSPVLTRQYTHSQWCYSRISSFTTTLTKFYSSCWLGVARVWPNNNVGQRSELYLAVSVGLWNNHRRTTDMVPTGSGCDGVLKMMFCLSRYGALAFQMWVSLRTDVQYHSAANLASI